MFYPEEIEDDSKYEPDAVHDDYDLDELSYAEELYLVGNDLV